MTLIGTQCAGVSRGRKSAGGIDVLHRRSEEEELVDAFLIACGAAGSFRCRSRGQKLVWQACKRPLVRQVSTCGSHEMQFLAEKVTHLQAHSHCTTAT